MGLISLIFCLSLSPCIPLSKGRRTRMIRSYLTIQSDSQISAAEICEKLAETNPAKLKRHLETIRSIYLPVEVIDSCPSFELY